MQFILSTPMAKEPLQCFKLLRGDLIKIQKLFRILIEQRIEKGRATSKRAH
jgi:hypothetical protein